jgi:flavorubredoxin
MALVDAGTIVLAGPAVHVGMHPKAANAAFLANALRPKAKFASYVGSFGWGHKLIEQLLSSLPNLKVELIPPVICRGLPKKIDLESVDALAAAIAGKHAAAGLK